jgi:hypothetical protein
VTVYKRAVDVAQVAKRLDSRGLIKGAGSDRSLVGRTWSHIDDFCVADKVYEEPWASSGLILPSALLKG